MLVNKPLVKTGSKARCERTDLAERCLKEQPNSMVTQTHGRGQQG